jgi:hypothetical protein
MTGMSSFGGFFQTLAQNLDLSKFNEGFQLLKWALGNYLRINFD